MKQLDKADIFIMLKITSNILKHLEGADTVIQSKRLKEVPLRFDKD